MSSRSSLCRHCLVPALFWLAVSGAALAGPAEEDPAVVAWRHFSAGRELVDGGKMPEGIKELRAARTIPALAPPETDFYLGMAYDALHQLDAAIVAYRRYLAQHPGTLNGHNVGERLPLLEQRHGPGPYVDPDPDAAPPNPPSAAVIVPAAPPSKVVPPAPVHPPSAPSATSVPAPRKAVPAARPKVATKEPTGKQR